jgi:hypothetical protein
MRRHRRTTDRARVLPLQPRAHRLASSVPASPFSALVLASNKFLAFCATINATRFAFGVQVLAGGDGLLRKHALEA